MYLINFNCTFLYTMLRICATFAEKLDITLSVRNHFAFKFAKSLNGKE